MTYSFSHPWLSLQHPPPPPFFTQRGWRKATDSLLKILALKITFPLNFRRKVFQHAGSLGAMKPHPYFWVTPVHTVCAPNQVCLECCKRELCCSLIIFQQSTIGALMKRKHHSSAGAYSWRQWGSRTSFRLQASCQFQWMKTHLLAYHGLDFAALSWPNPNGNGLFSGQVKDFFFKKRCYLKYLLTHLFIAVALGRYGQLQ